MCSSNIKSDDEKNVKTIHAASQMLNLMRNKRLKIKRRSKFNMRVYAMLSSSVIRIEDDIRNKQQERAKRWALFQLKIIQQKEKEEMEAKKQIDKVWSEDLHELNNFFNGLTQIKTVVVR